MSIVRNISGRLRVRTNSIIRLILFATIKSTVPLPGSRASCIPEQTALIVTLSMSSSGLLFDR